MKPEQGSNRLLSVTRSKAKMYEYNIPEEAHIDIPRDPSGLFPLTIGLLGELSAQINSDDINEADITELQDNLQFSARFFDAYQQSKLNTELDQYLLLLGAASYYLCDFPGSSIVLARAIRQDILDVGGAGLENLLLWLLQLLDLISENDSSPRVSDPLYSEAISNISTRIGEYFRVGSDGNELLNSIDILRRLAYENGTSRQLLLADVVSALTRKRIQNSTWASLPQYSNIPINTWRQVFEKESFIRELWPAQHLLGKEGVFAGKSAVVQMPTSAGKTKATEIIIRSAFLSRRAFIAVIVAPFRALCHEISDNLLSAFHGEAVKVDAFSDVLQQDYTIDDSHEDPQIWVVTPEKFLYMLRHDPDLVKSIGLLIYDEGHQFDNGTRGVTYELLLSSLKLMIPETIQTVLISAVISNANAINEWLNGNDSVVVSGENMTPTYQTLAFASWLGHLGRLQFVTPKQPDNDEFFVPRIIEEHNLQLRGRERKKRPFPEKKNGSDIALYLGLKLIDKGSVAIFCGTKPAVVARCKRIVDIYDRGLSIAQPIESSSDKSKQEITSLSLLHERHLGSDAVATQCARIGVFSHHGSTPHGIRIAVEYALKKGLAKFVICTSTLAQGVNLPIRYLILSNVYQGQEQIKTRDFHNLIGRAGRSGMHTEGSILFADPDIYDTKNTSGRRRWRQIADLFIPANAEPCVSTLFSFFDPFQSDDKRYHIPWSFSPLDFARTFLEEIESIISMINEIATEHADSKFTMNGLERQIEWKQSIIAAIESYLMAHWDDSGSELSEDNVTELAMGTLAYFLADEDQKTQLIELFKLIAENIGQHIPEKARRQVFGRTLYGVRDSISIETWIIQNLEKLKEYRNYNELFSILWPLIQEHVQNDNFQRYRPSDTLEEAAVKWLEGISFHELYEFLKDAQIRPRGARRLTIEHVVEICENGLAYEGALVLGAVVEIVDLINPENKEQLIADLQDLQKRLKYGLASHSAITLYELGFADRVVSQELSAITLSGSVRREDRILLIRQYEQQIRSILVKYPSYFVDKLDSLLQE